MPDLTLHYTSIRDEYTFNVDGEPEAFKVAVFRLGRFGPFTERLALGPNWQIELAQRIELLKRAIDSLPT